MTQKSVAEKCGVTNMAYSRIECGNRMKYMTIPIADKLAVAFDVPLNVILNGERAYQQLKNKENEQGSKKDTIYNG